MKHSIQLKQAVSFVNKRRAAHLREKDPEGFFICPIQDLGHMVIAPKGEWLGTEEARKEAIKEHQEEIENVFCDFCDFCKKLKEVLRDSSQD